jgi:type VI secretion system secreted protein Hcp
MTRKTILASVMVLTVIVATISASSFAYAAVDPKPKDTANSFFDIFTKQGYSPDSFFDIFTDLQTSSTRSDSFFDVFFDVFRTPDSFFDVFTELQQHDASQQTQIDELNTILDQVIGDSFFDITYRIDIPGITEGSIEVIGYSQEVITPLDPTSGQASGKRQHKPFTITKEIDKSSPLLFKALVDGEVIPSLELKLFRPNPSGDGTTQNYYTIELQNVRVSSITKPLNPEPSHPVEEISFVFQKIKWTWVDDGTTFEDDLSDNQS